LSHGRAIRKEKCQELKMDIVDLDVQENHTLRDLIWKLWCYYELHLERALTVSKVYENSSGCSIQKMSTQIQIIAQPAPAPQPQQPGMPPKKPNPLPGLPGTPFPGKAH